MNLIDGFSKLNKWTLLIKAVRYMIGSQTNLNERNDGSTKLQTDPESPSPQSQTPESQTKTADPDKWLKGKDARNWALTRLGHEGVMLDKIQRQNRIVENTVKGLQEGGGISTETGEDDMGVNIGNETNYYHESGGSKTEEKLLELLAANASKKPEPDKKPSSLIPASIVAAGALTGAGLYFGDKAPQLPPTEQSPVQIIPETPTDIGVGFGDPQPIREETGNIVKPVRYIIKE